MESQSERFGAWDSVRGDFLRENLNLFEANNLIGMEVMGTDDQTIGTLDDLIVDSNQNKIGFALLTVDEAWTIQDAVYLVKWDHFEVIDEEELFGQEPGLYLTIEESQLEQMPAFEEDVWQEMEIAQIRSAIREHYDPQQEGRQMQRQGGQRQLQQQGCQIQQVQGQITDLGTRRINNRQVEIQQKSQQQKQSGSKNK